MRPLDVFRTRQKKRSRPRRYATARRMILYNAEYYRKLNMEHWIIPTGKLRNTHRIGFFFRVIKSRLIRWVGYVLRMGGTGMLHTWLQWRNVREIEHLEELVVYRRTISNWGFKKWVWEHGLYWSVSGHGQVAGACECGDEPSVSIKGREFIG